MTSTGYKGLILSPWNLGLEAFTAMMRSPFFIMLNLYQDLIKFNQWFLKEPGELYPSQHTIPK